MTRLIANDNSLNDGLSRDEIQHITNTKVPHLDPELRLLIIRCLAVDPQNRPRLAVLLDHAISSRLLKTAASYGGLPTAQMETDEHIRQIIQEFVFNAANEAPHNAPGTLNDPIVI